MKWKLWQMAQRVGASELVSVGKDIYGKAEYNSPLVEFGKTNNPFGKFSLQFLLIVKKKKIT